MQYAEDMVTTLELERLDRDLFRGVNTVMAKSRPSLYGGQVAGQALMAAGLIVPPELVPHSLHGYFLRPGLIDKPVVLQVDRDRRSFSARHVSAIQDGEVIFSMLASFHRLDAITVFDDAGDIDAPLVDDRVLHMCALTYISDMGPAGPASITHSGSMSRSRPVAGAVTGRAQVTCRIASPTSIRPTMSAG